MTQVFKIQSIGDGFLAIMAHPASNQDLESGMKILRQQNIRQVVSLLSALEIDELGLAEEEQICHHHAMRYLNFAIKDFGLPESLSEFSNLAQGIYQEVEQGNNTVIHCRTGIGRSAMLSAAILGRCGFDATLAFAHISQKRGESVPDSARQADWISSNWAHFQAVN